MSRFVLHRFVFYLVAGWLLGACPVLFAADCASLKTLKLADTQITMAEAITAGGLKIAGAGAPLNGLPAFCRVAGELHPTSDSAIGFEVWLPAEKWNGRLLGSGNGGFAGSIWYAQLADALKRGFAVTATDGGHQAEGTDATWAYGHPEKVKDFGWRALHLTTERAKEILTAYYGKTASKSYFDACSDGGREALMEAQRFPEDYDGILAGAPANNWAAMLTGGAAAMQTFMSDPRSYIPPRKLPLLEHAALAACDALDGARDGVISDPERCHFDAQVLLCKGGDAADCLTQPQIDAVKALYAGAKDKQGKLIFPGFAMGDETGWRTWVTGEDAGASLGSRFVRNYFRYMATDDPRMNVLTAQVDDLLEQARARTSADVDATNPDLSRFAARGGKLIIYHGWDDPAISPRNSIAYVGSVEKRMGKEKTDAFLRLYMVPGVEHCSGGPGASAFGQLGLATAAGPKHGLFDSLVDWVEKGSPDEDVIATKYAAGADGKMKPAFTRPLCVYPKAARYTGSGSENDAASFTCAAP